jgi:hypothetical protein
MVRETDLIPEWRRMRAEFQKQVELFGKVEPGHAPPYLIGNLVICIAELDGLIAYYSARKGIKNDSL